MENDSNGKILCLDDELIILNVYVSAFSRFGYTVVTGTNVIEGRKLFEQNPESYVAIITDNNMPGGNGIDFLEYLFTEHSEGNYENLPPRVLVTGRLDQNLVKRVSECGAHFLEKPLGMKEIQFAQNLAQEYINERDNLTSSPTINGGDSLIIKSLAS